MQLAELAANEQDPDKLLAIVTEINYLLDETHKAARGDNEAGLAGLPQADAGA